jgi:hypothetical protein
MQNRYKFITLLCGIIIISSIRAQDNDGIKKWSLNGYVSSMQSVIIIDSLKDYWITDYLLHNRLNFHWFPYKSLSAKIELRNRFMYGDQLKGDTEGSYKKSLEDDRGMVDMAWNIASDKSYILNTMIDRAYIQYTYEKFEVTVGRQRINWGQTFVWNPNDIFNTYSFFDFDYPERPGSDAIRLQYFTGMASVAEIALKSDSTGNITAAGLFRFNKYNYDIQVLGGILDEEDMALGIGWSGNIKNMAFRGEMSYFHPYRNYKDTTGLYFLSVGLDYSFSNSLYLQFEAFYRQMPKGFDVNDFMEFYSGPLSVKNLSFTEYNLFAQASYPLNPLFNGNLAVMYFPKLNGYYVGPSVSYSLMDNLDFSIYLQLFSGKFGDNRQHFNLGFLRFQYSF